MKDLNVGSRGLQGTPVSAIMASSAGVFAGTTLDRPQRSKFYMGTGKRLLDVALVILAAPFALILISICMVLVICCDGHKPFFAHNRIGRGGRVFRCWKLRTMVPNAEAKLALLLDKDPDARREWAETFKLTKDPRITRFGNFLRRSSLDELPQLWNVLTGEMSLVGPRPVPGKELEQYGNRRRAYLSLRPGITGAWQISGRNDLSYSSRVALDVAYLREVGLMLDLRIIYRTIMVVLKRTGR